MKQYPLTCESCGGDLLAGRNFTVCERGCPIHHKTPVGWLEKHHPERKIEHAPFRTVLKEVGEGCKQLAAFDRDTTGGRDGCE